MGFDRRSAFRIVLVVGARPNFMKAAPVLRALRATPEFESILVHTGQHYDDSMSQVFFQELDLPEPDLNLGVGSDTHARQTAGIMMAFEPVLEERSPDLVIVVGDVNSTLACALVAQRLGIEVAHVEAGLRSRDRTMPEELNRVLTDQLSDWLYTSCEDAGPNLLAEGVPGEKIVFVGNVMIDSLLHHAKRAEHDGVLDRLRLRKHAFALVTLHRPATVDNPDVFGPIVQELGRLSEVMPVVFPMHPRTRGRLDAMTAGRPQRPGLLLTDPLGYHAFLRLTMEARLVITDSGGIQEETTYLGVPCLTVRENTERPITIRQGTNRLVGLDRARLRAGIDEILSGGGRAHRIPAFWDGHASIRIAQHLRETYLNG